MRAGGMTVVQHPPTLVDNGDAADLKEQREAAVEGSRADLPQGFLEFLPVLDDE